MSRLTRKLLWMTALAVAGATSLLAQNIAGTRQGSLQGPDGRPALRIVMKISRADNEILRAVLYSIDQGGQPINAGSVTLQGANLKMAIPALGGNYDGVLKGDAITGTWTQGGPSGPLDFVRATTETAWAIPEPPPPPKPVAGEGTPVFEVSTVKPSNPDTPGQSILEEGVIFLRRRIRRCAL